MRGPRRSSNDPPLSVGSIAVLVNSWLRRVAALAAIILFVSVSARADLASDLQALAAKSFDDRLAAVKAVADKGDARAAPALEAMLKGRLYTRKADKRLVIAVRKGPRAAPPVDSTRVFAR